MGQVARRVKVTGFTFQQYIRRRDMVETKMQKVSNRYAIFEGIDAMSAGHVIETKK